MFGLPQIETVYTLQSSYSSSVYSLGTLTYVYMDTYVSYMEEGIIWHSYKYIIQKQDTVKQTGIYVINMDSFSTRILTGKK